MTDLSVFISSTVDSIVDEWESFARSTGAAAARLSPVELRDHAKVVLLAVAADMQQRQSGAERHRKSVGEHEGPVLNEVQLTSREHARARFDQGFSLKEMVSEYRALRASVIRRWTAQTPSADARQLDDLTRFGEAIDEGLTESIDWYSSRLEGSRNLLIGVLAHDLRTPLSAVVMSAQYLLRSERLAHEELRAASRITSSAMRMSNYIKDLLDFAQTLLGDGLHVVVAPMNLRLLCEEVADEQRAANPGATIEVHADDDVMGQWDGQRLAQLVGNLVANAIAHGDAAHPVTLSLSQTDQVATVAVHNHGAPVDAQRLPDLFQPLLQKAHAAGDRQRGSSGMGLGLYIARLITDAHGGSIGITSEAEAGTTVLLHLPKRPGPAAPRPVGGGQPAA